ncbi:hypothetical protein EV127DRAFT_108354 [Xylaria flabelliformis]|nr:hypothetical protein EV127DRAFT_108354 [Xylaria flabelliformis]
MVVKPGKTSQPGRLNKPIYARTSVLCNGQIVWKVGSAQDMEHVKSDVKRAELKSPTDVMDDLNALNSLQLYRAKPLTPLELKQPLRHVQSCLPGDVKARIYTGDLYGSAEGVFSCPDHQFETRAKRVFENEVRGDGEMNYNDFFRRLRRAEWLLWDVEAEEGCWVAVIAHLYKSTIRNPNKKSFPDDPDIRSSIISPEFNKIDEWCVVTAKRSPEGEAMVDRVKNRLSTILRKGKIGIDQDSEVKPAIWVPMDETNWSSGLHVYSLIKTLMHRLTELHCTKRRHRPTFWHPVSGWLNIDEVRAEMQGRAAQRCMAATGYRSRIAIEGVHRSLGMKEVVLAKELRPRYRDNQAYRTGKVGEDGRCIPVDPDADSTDDGSGDDDDEGEQDLPPSRGQRGDLIGGGLPKPTPSDKKGKQPDDAQSEFDVNKFGGTFKVITPTKSLGLGSHGQMSGKKTPSYKFDINKFNGPLDTPPSYVHGWNDESADDIDPSRHAPVTKLKKLLHSTKQVSTKQVMSPFENLSENDDAEVLSEPTHPEKEADKTTSHPQHKFDESLFHGPLDSAPSYVYGWNDDSTDDDFKSQHIPLTKLAQLKSRQQKLIEKATPQAQDAQSKPSDSKFAGPLDTPPSSVYGWDDEATDYEASFEHIPLTKVALLNKLRANKSLWKSLKESVASSERSSVKGRKRKQVDKHEGKNSRQKTQAATTASAVQEKGDGNAADPWLQDIFNMLD